MLHTDKKNSILFAKQLLEAHLNEPEETRIKLRGPGAETIEALFLGSKGENAMILYEIMELAIRGNIEYRKDYFPGDPGYISEETRHSEGYINTMAMIVGEYIKLVDQLKQSGTFFSMRTIGHM